jgi:nicotinate-nucleotide adenylyltransferase
MAVKPRRVGVFGGSFDPPHATHVALAVTAMSQAGLSELRIFPTGRAWHKSRTPSDASHRLAMARLAFGGIPGVVVDAREIARDGPTYTLDTLRELQAEQPDAQLVLLMGSDQARALASWHGWREILAMAVVCVAQRLESLPSGAPAGSAAPADAGPGADDSAASTAARFEPSMLPGLAAGARFETLELPPAATSATEIRRRVAQGEDLAGLVPPGVERYIDQHHLYAPA